MEHTDYDQLPRSVLVALLREHDASLRAAGKDGIVMSYTGRAAPWQIIRLVKPKLSRIIGKLSQGDDASQCRNQIWDGENLSAMVTLYQFRGQVDLILTDPPYNTGEDFRYNDRWDKDPDDPDLGDIVPKDDGSRHSKWLRFMTPRLWMMKEMLRASGVIAVCIDYRELFRLGMVMDEIFGENNRIGIVNWQKSYSPKSDTGGSKGGLSSATEYVLVYAKDASRAQTQMTERTAEMNARYGSPDNDPEPWKSGDASAPSAAQHLHMVYAIQSPFTGQLYYPPKGRCWATEKRVMKELLEQWGSEYREKWIDDGNILTKDNKTVQVKALVLKGTDFTQGAMTRGEAVVKTAGKKAAERLRAGAWPPLYFGQAGDKGPQVKVYLRDVRKGKVPMSYWADEDYESPLPLGSQSWNHSESGHSQAAVHELDEVVGKGHGFKTVKPLRLFKKLIQIWCRPNGLVLDPFAGSGTTAHAVLELNADAGADRRFILIEPGNTDRGDHYAKTLTAERVRRVITGKWAAGNRRPLAGGFRFIEMKRQKIDASAVNALAREELIDLLLTSYWDRSERAQSYLMRYPIGQHRYLFAANARQEGFFLVWDAAADSSLLDRQAYKHITREAQEAGLKSRYHVYAALAPYTGPGIEFYKIPEKVLEHIGFNAREDAFNSVE